jgi:hypothetical protein
VGNRNGPVHLGHLQDLKHRSGALLSPIAACLIVFPHRGHQAGEG